MEFHIAPVPAELGRPPGIAEMTFAGYRADLAANGLVTDPEFAGFWQWFGLRTQAPELSYVGTYNGRKYALLCALPPHAMFIDVQGPGTWGLKKVYATTDSEGRLAIGFELDENGAKLFPQLSYSEIGDIGHVFKGLFDVDFIAFSRCC